jgi:hypothetical protein
LRNSSPLSNQALRIRIKYLLGFTLTVLTD